MRTSMLAPKFKDELAYSLKMEAIILFTIIYT